MIDHLLRFADEVAAIAACPQFRTEKGWDTSRVIPGCRVYTVADGVTEYLPYWYLWVALSALDAVLTAMPECMIAADREAAAAGEPYALFSRVPVADLPAYHVEPVIAGSNYPFKTVLRTL